MPDGDWFERRFETLKWLGLLAAVGAVVGGFTLLARRDDGFLIAGTIVLILPAFLYAFVLPILHWKERYVGNHSDFWGVLLLVEVSGWSKLIYWFRHILPDWQGNGRYRRQETAR